LRQAFARPVIQRSHRRSGTKIRVDGADRIRSLRRQGPDRPGQSISRYKREIVLDSEVPFHVATMPQCRVAGDDPFLYCIDISGHQPEPLHPGRSEDLGERRHRGTGGDAGRRFSCGWTGRDERTTTWPVEGIIRVVVSYRLFNEKSDLGD
jgi:hypothetical protein